MLCVVICVVQLSHIIFPLPDAYNVSTPLFLYIHNLLLLLEKVVCDVCMFICDLHYIYARATS
jgi:hypothetical protein